MTGTDPDGVHYVAPDVPWVNYFNGGDAVHGYPRASYGFPQSNGCVELPIETAAAVLPDAADRRHRVGHVGRRAARPPSLVCKATSRGASFIALRDAAPDPDRLGLLRRPQAAHRRRPPPRRGSPP